MNIIIMILNMFYGAFIGMKLWSWFIVPFGIVEIKMAHAFGINLLVKFWTMRLNNEMLEDRTDEEKIKAYSILMFAYTLFLIMGYFASKLM